MTSFLLIPGAGGSAWYWHRLVPELERRGHHAVAVELPGADPTAGLPAYADLACDAGAGMDRPVVVGQSLGGFTAPQVAERLGARHLVLLNAMIPSPGEAPGQWFARHKTVGADFDVWEVFFHDVPDDVVAQARAQGESPEADVVFDDPWPLEVWPDVPTTVLAGADDRFFGLDLQRRLARERLCRGIDALPGGHLIALSQPEVLADRLTQLVADDLPHRVDPERPASYRG